MSVAVVIVSWNSAAVLANAVRSAVAFPLVVVDNASTDGSAEVARQAGARVVALETNIGFGPACNRGASELPDTDAIFFLNPDAAIVSGVDTLLDALRADASLGAVAPALVGDGQERFQLRRFPTLGSLAREAFLVNRLLPDNAGLRKERYLDRAPDTSILVEQPAAAALMVRRSLFERLGGFDPDFAPAWFEDVDLCERIWKSGARIRYVPAARVTHAGGSTMKTLPYRDFLPLYTRNQFRYLARHRPAAFRVAAWGIAVAGAVLRLALLPVVTGDHGRRETAAGYGRVLRGLLGLGWRSSLLPRSAA